jgi:hypothetical protein
MEVIMEDVRCYLIEDEDDWTIPDDEREYGASPEDEVPYHIPRD